LQEPCVDIPRHPGEGKLHLRNKNRINKITKEEKKFEKNEIKKGQLNDESFHMNKSFAFRDIWWECDNLMFSDETA
jgi:hypothetical protein